MRTAVGIPKVSLLPSRASLRIPQRILHTHTHKRKEKRAKKTFSFFFFDHFWNFVNKAWNSGTMAEKWKGFAFLSFILFLFFFFFLEPLACYRRARPCPKNLKDARRIPKSASSYWRSARSNWINGSHLNQSIHVKHFSREDH